MAAASVVLVACGTTDSEPGSTSRPDLGGLSTIEQTTSTSGLAPPPTDGNESTVTEQAAGTESALECDRVLARGCEGDAVARLQRLLVEKGVAELTVDGQFGSLTESAVDAFESTCDVCERDGVIEVDGDEWQTLDGLADPATGEDGNDTESAGACLDCADDPEAGTAGVLDFFTGGASTLLCDALEDNGTVAEGELYAGLRRDVAQLGRHTFFCLLGFRLEEPVAVQFDYADGSSRSVTISPSGGTEDVMVLDGPSSTEQILTSNDPGALGSIQSILWLVPPTAPLGSYEIQATQDWVESNDAGETVEFTQSASSRFDLVRSTEPIIEVNLPQRFFGEEYVFDTYQPGDTLDFFLSGFPPGGTVKPLLYRHDQDSGGCDGFWCFATTLDDVSIDENGVGLLQLPTDDSDPEGLYCVTSVLTQDCKSDKGFSGEFFLGEPYTF